MHCELPVGEDAGHWYATVGDEERERGKGGNRVQRGMRELIYFLDEQRMRQ